MNTDIAAQKALDRLARVGFEKLTDSEKILAAAWTVEADFVADAFSCGDCPRYCHSLYASMAKSEDLLRSNIWGNSPKLGPSHLNLLVRDVGIDGERLILQENQTQQ